MCSIPSLDQWVKDLALPWLWCRPAAAAPIRPQAWEPPYAVGVALKNTLKKRRRKKKVIYTKTEYYSASRRKAILPPATAWVDLGDLMLSEISQAQKDKRL